MKFNEVRILIKAKQQVEKEIGSFNVVMGVEAKNFFTLNFRKQGFDDTVIKRWKGRERNTDPGRGVLIGKGTARLKNSIMYRRLGAFSVVIFSSVPYAKVHNDGLRSGRGRGFKMPQRQFIGDSSKLNKTILSKLDKRIQKAFR